MDLARTADDSLVTLEMLRELATIPELWCTGQLPDGEDCDGKAWPAALHSQLKAAYLAAHHRPQCEYSSERSADREGDAGHNHAQGELQTRWRIRLTLASPTTGPDGRNRPDDGTPGTRTRRTYVDSTAPPSDQTQQRSLSTLLAGLITGTTPRGLELELGAKKARPALEVVTHARDAHAAKYADTEGVFWGEVSDHYRTRYGSQLLRLKDAADQVAILLDSHILLRLGVSDPTPLIGRHVIAFGTYTDAAAGKRPHIRAKEISHLAFIPRVRRQ